MDVIRKAVELADGWHLETSWHYPPDACFHGLTFRVDPSGRYYQMFLDALAAQLVRQVDALYAKRDPDTFDFEFPAFGSLSTGAGVVYPGDQFKQEAWIASNSDRTMNTLKAIIDSKVLDNG